MSDNNLVYESNLTNCKSAIKEATENGLDALALYIRDQAVRNITSTHLVDTGNLRSSVNYSVDVPNKTASVGTNVEYAIYTEFGTGIYAENGLGRKTPWFYTDSKGQGHITRGMKPRRWLRDAFERNHEQMKKVYMTAYNDKLK